MDDTSKQAVLSAVRSALLAIGGVFVATGRLSAANADTYVGFVMVLLPLLWGIADKFAAARKSNLVARLAVQHAVSSQAPTTTPLAAAEQKAIVAGAKAVVAALPEAEIAAALNSAKT